MKQIILGLTAAILVSAPAFADPQRDWDRHEQHERNEWRHESWRDEHREHEQRAWFVFQPTYETHYVPSFGYSPWKSYACTGWEPTGDRYHVRYVRTCYERF